jgi:hypothetical protein
MIDIEPQVPLSALDPERHDPGYWARFHARVMDAARPGLARRGRVPLTVGDALLSWSRLALPLAATAAAVATLLLVRAPRIEDLGEVAGLEEFLHQAIDAEIALPSFLYDDTEVDRDMVLLAVEEF